jgi:3-deoxy-manno-octulosonate cytidylyltransferase (CMP-KDO synthetase)
VKVVFGTDGRALYFSRAPIPFTRGDGIPAQAYRHIGLYAYTRAALKRFAHLPASPLEKAESLEQLRLLENGIPVYMCETGSVSPAVDVPADIDLVEALLKQSGGMT